MHDEFMDLLPTDEIAERVHFHRKVGPSILAASTGKRQITKNTATGTRKAQRVARPITRQA